MKILWNFINRRSLPALSKQKMFLALNTIVWALITLLVGLVIGLIRGFDSLSVEIIAILVGYATFGIGFLGGFIFLSNNT